MTNGDPKVEGKADEQVPLSDLTGFDQITAPQLSEHVAKVDFVYTLIKYTDDEGEAGLWMVRTGGDASEEELYGALKIQVLLQEKDLLSSWLD